MNNQLVQQTANDIQTNMLITEILFDVALCICAFGIIEIFGVLLWEAFRK